MIFGHNTVQIYHISRQQCLKSPEILILCEAGQNDLQKCPSLTKFLPICGWLAFSFVCVLSLGLSHIWRSRQTVLFAPHQSWKNSKNHRLFFKETIIRFSKKIILIIIFRSKAGICSPFSIMAVLASQISLCL